MAPWSKKKRRASASVEPLPAFEPSLKRSMVVNQEGLDKIRPVLAGNSNEWKATVACPTSQTMVDMAATEIPLHLHALLVGLIPLSLISSMPYSHITKLIHLQRIYNF